MLEQTHWIETHRTPFQLTVETEIWRERVFLIFVFPRGWSEPTQSSQQHTLHQELQDNSKVFVLVNFWELALKINNCCNVYDDIPLCFLILIYLLAFNLNKRSEFSPGFSLLINLIPVVHEWAGWLMCWCGCCGPCEPRVIQLPGPGANPLHFRGETSMSRA